MHLDQLTLDRVTTHARQLIVCVAVAAVTACDPYQCGTKARGADYVGVLGQAVAPPGDIASTVNGRIYLGLNEWQGSVAQQNVVASVNIVGFLPAVSEIVVREGTPATPGRALWSTSTGILVRDSVWNASQVLFEGPATWSDFWNALDTGHAYLEVHSPTDATVSGGLRQAHGGTFTPACT